MIELDVLSKADIEADGQPRFWRSKADLRNTAAHQAIVFGSNMPVDIGL